MKKIKIIRNGQITNEAQFQNEELLNEWLSFETANFSFGKQEYTRLVSPKEVIHHEEIPEVFIEKMEEVDGLFKLNTHFVISEAIPAYEEVIEAVYEIVPAEYTLEITDISAELEQGRKNATALEYLAATDFYIIRSVDNGELVPEEIKLARAEARLKIIK
jgi:hypothetical protein